MLTRPAQSWQTCTMIQITALQGMTFDEVSHTVLHSTLIAIDILLRMKKSPVSSAHGNPQGCPSEIYRVTHNAKSY